MTAIKCLTKFDKKLISLGMIKHRKVEYEIGKEVIAPESWLEISNCGLFVFDTIENALAYIKSNRFHSILFVCEIGKVLSLPQMPSPCMADFSDVVTTSVLGKIWPTGTLNVTSLKLVKQEKSTYELELMSKAHISQKTLDRLSSIQDTIK